MQIPAGIWKLGHIEPSLLSDELLGARLAESITWCDSLLTLADFRATTLEPNMFHDGPDDLVCSVGQSRQSLLRYRKLPVSYQLPTVAAGRIMLYFPDENLTDGAAGDASDGFFDAFNLPPFDTWISFFIEQSRPRSSQRYLLCYVPPSAIAAADAGIEVNPEECIVWLDKSDVSIRQRVDRSLRRK